ncbi:hypothetical protein HMPREF0299_5407 [Corynebacterium matruchotii ATCC 14266]|uniref:Uncharacterized protein n=1 Tax=Corynebacterium matruchotii ATCC 14266 TaxID=553207 RepID=E0DI97_9CORY|nr:hypothetical protein HMPREF0299_5407 [Corynebacterium matruchotii ATCC 14266]
MARMRRRHNSENSPDGKVIIITPSGEFFFPQKSSSTNLNI